MRHRLVADDAVEIKHERGNVLLGRARETIGHYIEIRGIGIIDVISTFGIRGVRLQKRVEVEVHLEEAGDISEYDRTGLKQVYTKYLGVEIPWIRLPIFPGKNITVIAEAVALNYLLRSYGYNPAEELNKRLIEIMEKNERLKSLLKGDVE